MYDARKIRRYVEIKNVYIDFIFIHRLHQNYFSHRFYYYELNIIKNMFLSCLIVYFVNIRNVF